jgi:hypothetical protein
MNNKRHPGPRLAPGGHSLSRPAVYKPAAPHKIQAQKKNKKKHALQINELIVHLMC